MKAMKNSRAQLKKLIVNNFIGGIAWGFGSVIGATVVVALLFWLLKYVNVIPVIGDFVAQIVQYVALYR